MSVRSSADEGPGCLDLFLFVPGFVGLVLVGAWALTPPGLRWLWIVGALILVGWWVCALLKVGA